MIGRVTIEKVNIHADVVEDRREINNVFVDLGYNMLRNLYAGTDAANSYISQLQVGTGTEAATDADETLQLPIVPVKAIASKVVDETNFWVDLTAYLLSSEGNGFNISEAGLLSVGNTLIARTTFSAMEKTEDYMFTFQWRVSA